MTLDSCPACGAASLRPHLRLRRLELWRCTSCGHTKADHRDAAAGGDYHEQYGADLADSLEKTRRRQARRIAAVLESFGSVDDILDFGCGRGWFLEECRAQGMRNLAGLDTSSLAISLLRERRIEGHVLPTPNSNGWKIPSSSLSFEARVITFLDVIEHFDPSDIRALIDQITREFAKAGTIVVKVPVSSGLLYRLSLLVARLGIEGPLLQLYQHGTFPPHYHYFSRTSVRKLLGACGFEVAYELQDPDFDAAVFRDRVAFLRRLPSFAGVLAGAILRTLVQGTRTFDTTIVLARRVSAESPEYRERDLPEGVENRESAVRAKA